METSEAAIALDPRSTSLSHLLQQGSTGSAIADSTGHSTASLKDVQQVDISSDSLAVSTLSGRAPSGTASADSVPLAEAPPKDVQQINIGSDSLTLSAALQQALAGTALADSTPIEGAASKDGKRKKDESDSPALDTQNLAGLGDSLRTELAVATDNGLATQARPARSAGNRTDIALPAGLAASTSATQDEFHVEWNRGRSAESPAELAFALRLKPLVSASVAQPASSSSLLEPHKVGAKTSETSDGALAVLDTPKPSNKQDGKSQSGNEDASRRDHTASHESAVTDQAKKSPRSESPTPSAPVESVRTQGEESRVTPLIHSAGSPMAPDGPAAPKATTPTAPVPAALSVDTDDRLNTTRPMKELSLQISSAGEQKVDVHLVQRGGEVLVSVRTQDTALAHEMRQDLGSLTGKLSQSGYGTEQFAPSSASSTDLSGQRDAPQNHDSSHGQAQDQQGSGSGQQQQPQDERRNRPAWVEEMENSLAQRQTNRSTAWLLNR